MIKKIWVVCVALLLGAGLGAVVPVNTVAAEESQCENQGCWEGYYCSGGVCVNHSQCGYVFDGACADPGYDCFDVLCPIE
jgi:hypothetical protein